MSATHLNVDNHPSYAQSTDFLNLEEPPAAKESPSGSQFSLAGYDDTKDGNYTHNYQPNLRQARMVNANDSLAGPPVGEPVRRRSTNYIDALQDKAKNHTQKQDRVPHPSSEDQAPVFKPSYAEEKQEAVPRQKGGYDESGEDHRPDLDRRKSSFAYEDFKKDVYDRLKMFDKE